MAKAVVQAAKDREILDHEELHSKVEYVVAHGISTTIEDKKCNVIGSSHFVFEDEQCTIPEGKDRSYLTDFRKNVHICIHGNRDISLQE